jgi:nicotinamide-nucleotide amidase
MQSMFVDTVLPVLTRLFPQSGLRFAAFRTCGVAESELAQRLQPLVAAHADVTWAFYPSWGNVDIKVRRTGGDEPSWTALCDGIRAALGRALYATDDASLAEIVQGLLLERGLKLAVAESCTGGMVASRVTDIAGSSAVFNGGFVPYANAAKEEWLGVPADMLRQHGAVSAEVAASLARNALRLAHADIAVSVTGIAGPTGGTPEKPVGLIFLGLATGDGAWTRQLQLWQRRDTNRAVASLLALDMVRRHLLGMPVGDPA